MAKRSMPANRANPPDKKSDTKPGGYAAIYSGPIPPPNILKQLNEIVPDGAERIFTMAEKDQASEIALQQGTLELNAKNSARAHKERILAQWMAFFVCILFLGTGAYLVMNGHDKAGGILFGFTFASIVASFLYGTLRRKNQK